MIQQGAAVVSIGALALLGVASAAAVWRHSGTDRICLLSDVALVDGMSGCVSPGAIAGLMDAAVLGSDQAPQVVTLTAADGLNTSDVSTCTDYLARRREGWYAETSRDMARESYFARACGALAALAHAKPGGASAFSGGRLSKPDVAALAAETSFAFGPDAAARATRVIEEGPDWRIETDDAVARIQPLAHADFDGDGRREVLIFVDIRPVEGTARSATLGLVKKDGDRLAFTPLSGA